MIGSLRGVLRDKRPPHLLIEVGGVGYELEAPLSTCDALPEIGEAVFLHTHLIVRADAHLLFGFAAEAERRMFRALIRVAGVGAKMGLAILSGMSVADFIRTIRADEPARLTRLPGVGRKTAERLIVEMRDSLAAWGDLPGASDKAPSPGDPAADAVHALVALGYRPREAESRVRAVADQASTSADIIRLALQR